MLQVNFWKPGQTAGVYAPGKRGKNLGLLTKKPRETDSRAPLVMPEVCVKLGDTPEISSQHSSEVMAGQEVNLCNKKFVFQVKIRLWAEGTDGKLMTFFLGKGPLSLTGPSATALKVLLNKNALQANPG